MMTCIKVLFLTDLKRSSTLHEKDIVIIMYTTCDPRSYILFCSHIYPHGREFYVNLLEIPCDLTYLY